MSVAPHELDPAPRSPRRLRLACRSRPGWVPRRPWGPRRPGRDREAARSGGPRGLGPARATAAAVLVLLLIFALGAPLMLALLGLPGPAHRDPAALNLFGNPTGPSGSHPLGVDGEGRDELARILYALRSLWLLSLAGTGLAVLLAWALRRLPVAWGSRRLLVGWAIDGLLSGPAALPPVLLGLALATRLGTGPLRLIVPIALTLLWPARRSRPSAAGLARLIGLAVAIDVSLTFLGMGPGGGQPQLGAMMAHAGRATLAGIPAWWTLVFPGAAILVLALAAEVLTRGPESPAATPWLARLPRPSARMSVGDRTRPWGAGLGGPLLAVAALALLGVVGFGGHGRPGLGTSALGRLGSVLGASGSLLCGAGLVWLLLGAGALWLHSLPRGRPSLGVALSPLAVLLAAAPVAWVSLLSLLVFSDSVGSLPILPGAGSYTGLAGHPGRWAQALILPWLVLGVPQAAVSLRALSARGDAVRASAQQRVARSAGVPERMLARQRRRALLPSLLEGVTAGLPGFLSGAVVVEVTFRLPGAGALAVADLRQGDPASVSQLALVTGLLVILGRLAVDGWLSGLAPRRPA
ncbi:MAG TPA: ABC transporter permease subunit [Solirubrobacteraceae bacterium]|nr:ABC transporter permease subunit [Solirubrobacteraceae bacterium]